MNLCSNPKGCGVRVPYAGNRCPDHKRQCPGCPAVLENGYTKPACSVCLQAFRAGLYEAAMVQVPGIECDQTVDELEAMGASHAWRVGCHYGMAAMARTIREKG